MTPLMKRLLARINQYLDDSMNASSRSNYVFGVRTKTKYDLQRDFVADIKTINSIAVMQGDKKVQDMCAMQARQQKQQMLDDCDEVLSTESEA